MAEMAAASTLADLTGAERSVRKIVPWLEVDGSGPSRTVWLCAELPG
ncbi:MAG: hypothetical protein ACLGIA_08315 [Actinomycetes bacterium]